MRRRQEVYPDWFNTLKLNARAREAVTSRFSIKRDGYQRWYRGAPRSLAKSIPVDGLDKAWEAKCKAVDALLDAGQPEGERTYRVVLSAFQAHLDARLNADRRGITERTLHNYDAALNDFGNFAVAGRKVADMNIRDIGPEVFTAYARTFREWKASGFDSVVSRVGALFRWAVEMEYVDRYRPGPEFIRPDKASIRSQRIDLAKSYTPVEVAKLYNAANPVMRCWVALGASAAFNNSDIAHLPRAVVDLAAGVIDFRRRKAGKVRRVIPLPADVADLLRAYRRPDAARPADDGLFFLTRGGLPYAKSGKSRGGEWMPSDTVSRLFRKLEDAAEVPHKEGRNFSGLRTTFYNLAPRAGYDLERSIVMGRAKGTVDLDSYLEDVGLERVRHVVNFVWGQVQSSMGKSNPNG